MQQAKERPPLFHWKPFFSLFFDFHPDYNQAMCSSRAIQQIEICKGEDRTDIRWKVLRLTSVSRWSYDKFIMENMMALRVFRLFQMRLVGDLNYIQHPKNLVLLGQLGLTI